MEDFPSGVSHVCEDILRQQSVGDTKAQPPTPLPPPKKKRKVESSKKSITWKRKKNVKGKLPKEEEERAKCQTSGWKSYSDSSVSQ